VQNALDFSPGGHFSSHLGTVCQSDTVENLRTRTSFLLLTWAPRDATTLDRQKRKRTRCRRMTRDKHMHVDFSIRVTDLAKATKHLLFNRKQFADTDFADILVSETGATFRAVGTDTEVPVNGMQPGTARLPLRVLNRIPELARSYKERDIQISFVTGVMTVGRTKVRHQDIVVGLIPDQSVTLPSDATVLDTLAVARLLSPEEIVEQGLRERVEVAQERTAMAVANAAFALAEFGVPPEQLRALVDSRIEAVAGRLSRGKKTA
jgi:hypothetical protein